MVYFQAQSQFQAEPFALNDWEELLEPTTCQLSARLEQLRDGTSVHNSVKYSIQLFSDVEGFLTFTRVEEISAGRFIGWVVQLSCKENLISFILADTTHGDFSSRRNSMLVKIHGHYECIDPRCVLNHSTLLSWIQHELLNSNAKGHYRWVDSTFALRAL